MGLPLEEGPEGFRPGYSLRPGSTQLQNLPGRPPVTNDRYARLVWSICFTSEGPKGSGPSRVDENLTGMYLFGYGTFVSTVDSVRVALSKHFAVRAGYQLGSHLVVKVKTDRLGLRLVQTGGVVRLETSF